MFKHLRFSFSSSEFRFFDFSLYQNFSLILCTNNEWQRRRGSCRKNPKWFSNVRVMMNFSLCTFSTIYIIKSVYKCVLCCVFFYTEIGWFCVTLIRAKWFGKRTRIYRHRRKSIVHRYQQKFWICVQYHVKLTLVQWNRWKTFDSIKRYDPPTKKRNRKLKHTLVMKLFPWSVGLIEFVFYLFGFLFDCFSDSIQGSHYGRVAIWNGMGKFQGLLVSINIYYCYLFHFLKSFFFVDFDTHTHT